MQYIISTYESVWPPDACMYEGCRTYQLLILRPGPSWHW